MAKRLNYSSKRCALCDKVIADTFIVCKEHMEDYRKFGQEDWFKMLVNAQRRQFEIDKEEAYIRSGTYKTKRLQKYLTDMEKAAITSLREKGLGSKSISKVLKIPRQTIEDHIKRMSNKKP